jgi:hypothetical protein
MHIYINTRLLVTMNITITPTLLLASLLSRHNRVQRTSFALQVQKQRFTYLKFTAIEAPRPAQLPARVSEVLE